MMWTEPPPLKLQKNKGRNKLETSIIAREEKILYIPRRTTVRTLMTKYEPEEEEHIAKKAVLPYVKKSIWCKILEIKMP